jgi:hypothetical protein
MSKQMQYKRFQILYSARHANYNNPNNAIVRINDVKDSIAFFGLIESDRTRSKRSRKVTEKGVRKVALAYYTRAGINSGRGVGNTAGK